MFTVIILIYIWSLSVNITALHIKSYEILRVNNLKHRIIKRGINDSPHPFNRIKEINFNAHSRNFRLILTPSKDVIHHNFEAFEVDKDGVETKIHIDHDENVYHGRVFGAMNSVVHIHDDNGLLTGSIKLDNETYHIEPAWRHLSNHGSDSMITFKESDIQHFSSNNHSICGYIKEGKELEDNDDENEDDGYNYPKMESVRIKRQLNGYDNPERTRCPLLLVADYRFFREMGGSNTKTTINYLISLIDRVHKIYNDTNWTDRKEFDGIKGMGFIIKKIIVHNEPTESNNGGPHYNMLQDKWDVRHLLEIFSREHSHKDFCLAHLFTDLKFEGGILGLAYVGSPRRNSVGGICTPEYFKNGYTLYLNSGLSSSRNHYGQRVITREADLVTAHEFGHNWGSEHDPDIVECSPGASQGGSYLMYTYSVSGYDINNKKFSPCSLRSIRRVLVAKSEKCFSQQEESFCGNLRVEGSEQCDAGILGSEDNDPCCNTSCHLRPGAKCSDKNSPCCQNCQFMAAGIKCRDAQIATCERESRCTGLHAECPKSPAMPDDTECIERGLCKDGRCIPYCETLGHRSCMCDKMENACKRCCRGKHNNTCFAIDNNDILPDGTPCFQGFCNHGSCEKTVQDVVERFWNIIDEININTVLMFLRDNIVFAVVIITAFIWIPSSYLINYVDQKQLKEEKLRRNWQKSDQLISPNENRRIIYIKVPSRNKPDMHPVSKCTLNDYQL